MLIDALMDNPGPAIYYDQDFRNVLEDHMYFLQTHRTTVMRELNQMTVYKSEYDFFKLLKELGIPTYLNWLVMRMNNLTGPSDDFSNLSLIIVPNEATIEHIRQSHIAIRQIQ